jgi:hypothetical protein
MSSERINNCRVNIETLTETELNNIRMNIGERLLQGQYELLMIETELVRRSPAEVV